MSGGNGNGRRFDDGHQGGRGPSPFNEFAGYADDRDVRSIRRILQTEVAHNRLFRSQVRAHLQRAEARTLAVLAHLGAADPVPGPPLPLGVDGEEEGATVAPVAPPWMERRPTNAVLLAAAVGVGVLALLAPLIYHH